MLWTFHRRGQRFHYEIHQAENGLGFELVLYHPDGRKTTEQLADSAALNRRALELQRELLADSWFISSDPRR